MIRINNSSKQRIGVYGGTFNPVHHGHLINIELIREEFYLDKILIIPARIPVHKEISCSVTPDERYEMLEIALDSNPYLEASRLELDRNEASYTIITLNDIERHYSNSELFLIMGSDSFVTIKTWYEYEKIINNYNIIVLNRNQTSFSNKIHVDCKNILFFNNPLIEISSTEIREKINSGCSIKYLTPDPVIDYINNKGLYRN